MIKKRKNALTKLRDKIKNMLNDCIHEIVIYVGDLESLNGYNAMCLSCNKVFDINKEPVHPESVIDISDNISQISLTEENISDFIIRMRSAVDNAILSGKANFEEIKGSVLQELIRCKFIWPNDDKINFIM